MPAAPVRIHIHNPPAGPDRLRMEPADLQAAAAQYKLTIEITEDSGAGLPEAARGSDVLVLVAKLPLAEARKAMPQLRWVQTTFAGVEDLMADAPADLPVANASGVHAEKGGEFLLAAALMLAYQIPQFVTDKKSESWAPLFGPPLKQSRVTLLGVGEIGASAATALRQRGCRVTGVTRSGKTKVDLDRNATLDELDGVLAESDILLSSLPDTPQTQGLIDRRRIDLLPHGAGIANVGRAAAFDHAAIMDRLDAGTLRGAVLDVFETEPIPEGDRLWSTPRLIITPHCSVDDHTVYMQRCIDILIDNVKREQAGEPLRNLVDASRGY